MCQVKSFEGHWGIHSWKNRCETMKQEEKNVTSFFKRTKRTLIKVCNEAAKGK